MRETRDPNEMAGVAQDIAPLAWVIDEIRSSLNHALGGIRTFLANKQDVDALRQARNQVHQTNGALQLLDLRGVSLVTEAVERLLRQWEEQPRQCQPQAARVVETAAAAVQAYLDGLLSGRPNQPIRLFPYYRDILKLSGAARIHPADLVFPDLSRRPALHNIEIRPLTPEQLRQRRTRYEEGLLGFLRNSDDPRARRQMRDALADLEHLPARGIARSFWWVVRGLLDALDAQQVPVDVDLKRVLARLNLQLRRVIEDGGAVAERLMTDTLYFVGRADERVARVVEVRRLYGLDALMPPDFERPTLTAIDPEALRTLKEAMAQAKPLWIQQSSAAAPDLTKFLNELQIARLAAESLAAAPIARVLERIAALVGDRGGQAAGAGVRDVLGLEVAAALLFVELGIDELPALGAEYEQRANAVIRRLEAARRGQAMPEAGAWESELARRAQDRLTMGAVVTETQATLRAIEERLDRFFRNPVAREELAETGPMFEQVRGVLSMLGYEEPVAALRGVQQAVARFANPAVPPQPEEFARIAQNLGALGFFVETLDQEADRPRAMFRYDPVAGLFSADLGRPAQPDDEPGDDLTMIPPPGAGAAPAAPVAASAASLSGSASSAAAPAPPPYPGAAVPGGAGAGARVGASASPGASATAGAGAGAVPGASAVPGAGAGAGAWATPPARAPAPAPRADVVETKVSERLALAHLLARRLEQVPNDAGTRQALGAMLPLLDNEADLLDDAALKGRVRGARQALAQLIATPVRDVAQRLVELFAPPAPAAPPALTAPLPVSDAAADRELLDIFIEEAREVLEAIGAGLAEVRAAPDDAGALTAVRRAFHTLKGSSRMVGLKAFGEGAWAVEQCFNLWLAQERAATEDLIELASAAHRLMGNWIDRIAADPRSVLEVAPLVHAAQHVREGGAFAYGGSLPPRAPGPGPKDDGSTAGRTPTVLPTPAPAAHSANPATYPAHRATHAVQPAMPAAPSAVPAASSPPGVLTGQRSVPAQPAPVQPAAALPVDDLLAELQLAGTGLAAAELVEEPLGVDDDRTPADGRLTALPDFDHRLLGELASGGAGSDGALGASGPQDEYDPLPPLDQLPLATASRAAFDNDQEPPVPGVPAVPAMPFSQSAQGSGTEPGPGPDQSSLEPGAALGEAALADPWGFGGDLVPEDVTPSFPSPSTEPARPAQPASVTPAPAPATSRLSPPLIDPTRSEETRHIGPIEISHGLYSVFLSEADECVRTLLQDISEWRFEPHRLPSRNATRRAHSLAGISATVGLRPVWNIADPFDDLLTELSRQAIGSSSDADGASGAPLLSAQQFDVLERVVERLRGMLHVFAAGLYPNEAPLEAGAIQDMLRVVRSQQAWRGGGDGAGVEANRFTVAAQPQAATPGSVLPPAAGAGVSPTLPPTVAPSLSPGMAARAADPEALDEETALGEDVLADAIGFGIGSGLAAGALAPLADPDEFPFARPAGTAASNEIDRRAGSAGGAGNNHVAGVDSAGGDGDDGDDGEDSDDDIYDDDDGDAGDGAALAAADGADADQALDPAVDATPVDLAGDPQPGRPPRRAFGELSLVPAVEAGSRAVDAAHDALQDPAADDALDDLQLAPHIEPQSGVHGAPLIASQNPPAQSLAGTTAADPVRAPVSFADRLASSIGRAAPRGGARAGGSAPDDDPGVAAARNLRFVPPPVPPSGVGARGPLLAEDLPEVPRPPDELDADLMPVFVTEAQDLLPAIGAQLRALSANPNDREASRDLMRRLHTFKGSARMAGAMSLGDLAHEMEARIESAMQLVNVPSVIVDDLHTQFDRVQSRFEKLLGDAAGATEAANAASLEGGAGGRARPLLPGHADPGGARAGEPGAGALANPAGAALPGAAALPFVRVRADVLDKLVDHAGEVAISRSKLENEVGTLKVSLGDLTENIGRLRTQLREVEIQADAQIQARADQLSKESAAFDPLEFDRYSRLQELTRLLAESVEDVAMVQSSMQRDLQSADNDLTAQSRLTRDLQQQLMRVRLVPFGNVSERLYRVARQTAKEVGKRINLEIRGGATEIDRSVLERMAAPFEHLLRNSIVHGLESPHDRIAAKKPETGELLLEVSQEGNEIVVVYSDDGAGLNLERIRQRGIDRQMIGANQPVGERELIELIFAPGFSTASEVTELAGRGVGMDVVRSELSSFGGRIAVATDTGRGTRFTLYLPLTLAVTQVVLATVGQRRFAIPAGMVEQVKRFRAAWVEAALRDGVVDVEPFGTIVVRTLAQLLNEELPTTFPKQAPVAVLRSGEDRLGVVADEITASQEVVVKNVGIQVSRLAGILGATILGTGEIVLIVNPVQLIARAPDPPSLAESVVGDGAAGSATGAAEPELGATILVVDDSLTVRRVTQRLLERQGYRVVLAKDGVEALRKIQEGRPDLMLVDIEMPRMDGFDLARNIRANATTRGIPIIIITSRTAEKHRRVAFEIGVNEYLGKPYRDEELLELIRRYLGLRTPA